MTWCKFMMPAFRIIFEVILQWGSNVMACGLVFCMENKNLSFQMWAESVTFTCKYSFQQIIQLGLE